MTSLNLPGQKEGCYNDQYCISNGLGDYCNNLTGDCEFSYEEIELTRTKWSFKINFFLLISIIFQWMEFTNILAYVVILPPEQRLI